MIEVKYSGYRTWRQTELKRCAAIDKRCHRKEASRASPVMALLLQPELVIDSSPDELSGPRVLNATRL